VTSPGHRLLSVNKAFSLLRARIPTFPYERRLSKIDTLHLALAYIRLLRTLLATDMTLHEYLSGTLATWHRQRPPWASSDLVVRLNWLDWTAIGVHETQVPQFLALVQRMADLGKDT
jgi:hypothetical protein